MPEHLIFAFRFLLFVGLHSALATTMVKNRLANRIPCYRLCYNFLSLLMLAWAMAAYDNGEILYIAPGAWSLLMYLLQLFVAIILLGCLRQTGVSAFIGITPDQQQRLVTTGWYGVARHPLYLFSIIFMLLNPVMSVRWLLFTVLSAIYFVIGGIIEERRLVGIFGEEYRGYQARTPFIVPDIKRPVGAHKSDVTPFPPR